MNLSFIKKLTICLFLTGFVYTLSACDIIFRTNTTISGNVTIIHNGEPWIPDTVSLLEGYNNEARSTARDDRPIPPPYEGCPVIYVYSDPNGINDQLGWGYAGYPDDNTQGKYPFKFDIYSGSLPDNIYFKVVIPMAGISPSQMTKGIFVKKDDTNIELGVVNFDTMRLWGNLPITVNCEPYSRTHGSSDSYLYRSPELSFWRENGTKLGDSYIGTDGNWFRDILFADSEIPVTFTLDMRDKGGIFTKTLNIDRIVPIYNTMEPPKMISKQIIFTDSIIDFEAFTLSGTMELLSDTERQFTYQIYFYDTETDLHIGSAIEWNSTTNLHGISTEWETMVPAFNLPKTLLVKIRNGIDFFIVITEDTDMKNINLGTINLKDIF
jgi:hypothetical protein